MTLLYDHHRHFSGALAGGSDYRPPAGVTFFEKYDHLKAHIRSQYQTDVDMYRDGTRRISAQIASEGAGGCTIIAGFCGDPPSTLERLAAMSAGHSSSGAQHPLDIRLCLIREGSGYRNLASVETLRAVFESRPDLDTVDFCGPERGSRQLFEVDLATLAELGSISASRQRAGLRPLSIVMHVGEDVSLGPDLGIGQIRDALDAGVRTIAHGHWLWADPWCAELSPRQAAESGALLAVLSDVGGHLEVCPTSSRVLHGVTGVRDGLPDSTRPRLGTDNPAMLNVSIAHEAKLWGAWATPVATKDH
jgi:hypothetical protein